MGIFDDFTVDPDAKAPEFEPMAAGYYTFEIESIDGDKAVLKDTKSDNKIWQFFNFADTEERLAKAFGGLTVGARAALEVKHTVSKKDGKTYANVQLPFSLPTPGSYRVRIEKAEEKTTQKGNYMLVLTLKLSDDKNQVRYNWVKPNAASSDMARQMSKVNMNEMLGSFEKIDDTMNNPQQWVGAVGAAIVGIEPRDGVEYAVVKKWLPVDVQRTLPAWGKTEAVDPMSLDNDLDDELPDFL